MTREEAIQQLQNCKDLIKQDGQDYLDERDVPILDMAIEALSADATEMMEDGTLAVRVSDAKDVSRVLVIDSDSHVGGGLYYVDKDNKPTGKWIYLHGSIGSYMTISCPFCGKTFNDVAEWKYNYCPNCGARMKGADDETD